MAGPLKLLHPTHSTITTRSYGLFHRVMDHPSFGTDHEAVKWEAARHALTLAFGRANYEPILEDPTNILRFLVYHIARPCVCTRIGEEVGTEEVGMVELEESHEAVVMCAFAAFYNVDKDPAPVLVPERSKHLLDELLPGICRLIESDDRHLSLRRAAIYFFYCVADNWLSGPNPPTPLCKLIARFTTSWAKNTVHINREYGRNDRVNLTFLLRMLRSKAWRPHLRIPEGQLALVSELENWEFDLVEAVNDLDVLPYLLEAGNKDAIKGWLRSSWGHWHVLDGPSRQALVDQTRATRADRPGDLDGFEGAMGCAMGGVAGVIRRCKALGESTQEGDGWMRELEMGVEMLKGLKNEKVADVGEKVTGVGTLSSSSVSPPRA